MTMDSGKYFDWAASSPQDEEIVFEALKESVECFANPSAIHKEGQKAKKKLEEARTRAAKALHVSAEKIFWTSGGTESDHIPLLAQLCRPSGDGGIKGNIVISGIEHPALREQTSNLKNAGFSVTVVNPEKNGFVSAKSVIDSLSADTVFVTLMAVNNETGCVQNIYEIGQKIAEASKGRRKPHFHVDCVQAAGKIPLNLQNQFIDSFAFSAHKISGPRGIGLLVLNREIRPFLAGGGQEKNIRPGTENLFGAIAFSKCLEKYYLDEVEFNSSEKSDNLISEKYARFAEQKKNTAFFISELKSIPGCSLVPKERCGDESEKKFSPYVVQCAFKNIPGNVMVRALDAKGFSISTGSACSAKKQSRPILQAMQLPRDIQDTAVRFSFGSATKPGDIKNLVEAVKEIAETFS